MTRSMHNPEEKDRILREAFGKLKARGVSSAWAASQNPYSEIEVECRVLMGNTDFQQSLATYLRTHTGLHRAVTMLYTFIAMSATAQWDDGPLEHRGVKARGWFLYPLLTASRDFLDDRLFRLLRNGFAHWAFDWEVVGGDSYVVAYDFERDLPTAKMHQAECDAYHIVAFSLVKVLDELFISQRANPADA
jgi:hypothetical protein